MSKTIVQIAIVGLALLILTLVFFWDSGEQAAIPDSLGSLQRTEVITGQEAQSYIDRLHGKGVTPEANFIARYTSEDSEATFFISQYREKTDASEAESKMVTLIRNGHPVFGHYREMMMKGKTIRLCLGMGQAHFFFAHHDRVYWLSVDMPVAQSALESLVQTLET